MILNPFQDKRLQRKSSKDIEYFNGMVRWSLGRVVVPNPMNFQKNSKPAFDKKTALKPRNLQYEFLD